MPHLTLPVSPFGPAPSRLHYRERGRGPAVAILHGGWGYRAYSFDRQMEALATAHRVVAPDRTGYGGSGDLAALPPGFHRLAAEETVAVLDALGVAEAVLWGHSDGAVIAAWAAILHPRRVRGLVLEAFHYLEAKEASAAFFETGATAPERFGEEMARALAEDHGDPRWRAVVGMNSRAWLRIIEEGRRGERDLYQGRLGEVRVPVLLLHGRRDPRSEPGEIEAARRDLPQARLALLDAGHSPHGGRSGEEATRLAAAFAAEAWRDRA
ncbi:MAG TPA: alpha/beta fold hydrolase [Anaeromyxobacteraceae bacterium]|nr:alpha/beta fold hydrolase [Anaeromyxobacteraceae bacterium]